MSAITPQNPSDNLKAGPGRRESRLVQFGAAGGVAVAATLVAVLGHGQLHAPDLSVVQRASPQIQVHLMAGVIALGLGTVQILSPKGTLPHRVIGWIWVSLMMVLAGTSVFIKVIFPGHFSYIHVLTAWTLLAVPLGVMAVRRGNIAAHSRFMTNTFYLGLITAGAFTFLPGRILYQVFFGH